MRQMLKNKLKEQKGLTLIELLAVIVILGIIAAIAVPSILGLIDNSKKDAHVANAQQMINAGKMEIASNSTYQSNTTAIYLTLDQLVADNYLDPVDSPDPETYIGTVSGTLSDASRTSYVKILDGKVVGVKLINSKRGITLVPNPAATISPKDLVRTLIQNTPAATP